VARLREKMGGKQCGGALREDEHDFLLMAQDDERAGA